MLTCLDIQTDTYYEWVKCMSKQMDMTSGTLRDKIL